MSESHDTTRRLLLAALAGMTLTGVAGAAAPGALNVTPRGRSLVTYFSRSGNSRVIAGVIQRSLRADLFEIEAATPYPADYFQTVEQARIERAQGILPPLKHSVADGAGYRTVYLVFPVWGTSVPPVVKSFVQDYNFADTLLIPVITHGGYGIGDSIETLARLAPAARREKPLVIACDRERRLTETVNGWLDKVRS